MPLVVQHTVYGQLSMLVAQHTLQKLWLVGRMQGTHRAGSGPSRFAAWVPYPNVPNLNTVTTANAIAPQHMQPSWLHTAPSLPPNEPCPPVHSHPPGAVGTFLGDLVAQYLAHYAAPQRGRRRSSSGSSSSTGSSLGGFDYDPLRAARLVAYSALINTPMAHYWYILLDAAVLPATPTAPLAVAAKVLLDQFGQTPFGMALFFYMLKVFEGKPGQAAAEVKSKVGLLHGCMHQGF